MLNLAQIVTAIGGLGTAAFGLVDATKVFGGGVNHVGFSRIAKRVKSLMATQGQGVDGLTQQETLRTLKGNWFNGVDLNNQKAIAKSLIKLNMNQSNAEALAKATHLDSNKLKAVAEKVGKFDENGKPLSLNAEEGDLYARFDFIVTALLDEAYQLADQDYRNATRALAVVFSVVLSLVGRSILLESHQTSISPLAAIMVGLLATPLAPIAKDLSSALAASVNALQAVRK